MWQMQQLASSGQDPLRRWKRAGQRATRSRTKEDRLKRLLNDKDAALEWLELRSSFGAFTTSLSSCATHDH